jgi:hypothetical protein
MANEKKTPLVLVLSVIAFIGGMGLGAWGLIREDCIGGPGCWVGSGFLKVAAVILIIAGGYGMYNATWGRKK